jgi:glycerophosphoryl diester phosphodiesterase
MRPILLAMESGRILNIAHRASLDPTNENTLEGIYECIKLGVDGIEVDVQETQDHELILFHEQFVSINSKPTKIRDISLEDLNIVVNRGAQQLPPIARLEEALNIVRDTQTIVVLDIKTSGITDRVIDAIHKANVAPKTCISSFDHSNLQQAKRLDSTISTILTIGFSRSSASLSGFCWTIFALLVPLIAVRLVRADALLCPVFRLTQRLVGAAHRSRTAVLLWGIRSRDRLGDLVGFAPDGFVNDTPLLVQALELEDVVRSQY